MEVRSLTDLRRFDPAKPVKEPLFQSARLAVDLVCLAPGQEQKPHAHASCDKVYVVLEGCGVFTVGGEVREVGEKNVVAAPAGVEHGVKNDTAGSLVLLALLAPPPKAGKK
jgi:quercetin dioxygenase-like cupin family protein